MSELLTREQFVEVLEDCDDVLQPGHFSVFAKRLLDHDAALRAQLAACQTLVTDRTEDARMLSGEVATLKAQLEACEKEREEARKEIANRAFYERELMQERDRLGREHQYDINITIPDLEQQLAASQARVQELEKRIASLAMLGILGR